jgi:hypothetical protein
MYGYFTQESAMADTANFSMTALEVVLGKGLIYFWFVASLRFPDFNL